MSDRATIYGTMAGGTISGVIYDDEAAAVPEEHQAGYDLDTCSQKHSRMAAHQAQRIDHLEAQIDRLAANVGDLAAAVTDLTQTTAILIDNIHARLDRLETHAGQVEAEGERFRQTIRIMRADIGQLQHLITTDKIPNRVAAIEQTIKNWSAGR